MYFTEGGVGAFCPVSGPRAERSHGLTIRLDSIVFKLLMSLIMLCKGINCKTTVT